MLNVRVEQAHHCSVTITQELKICLCLKCKSSIFWTIKVTAVTYLKALRNQSYLLALIIKNNNNNNKKEFQNNLKHKVKREKGSHAFKLYYLCYW
jgi:hypothetical protein